MRLQQSNSIADMCRTFLTDAHMLFGALQGVVYARASEDSAEFTLQASFASDAGVPPTLQEGEGLLGQVAIGRATRVMDTAGEGYWTIRSGLGSATPGTLVMAPVVRNEQVLGLVEIALLDTPQTFPRDSFEELVHLLALNLQILLRADPTRQLLAQAQAIRQTNADQLHLQQTLIDTIPYPVFYKGADARFLGFNRAYEQAFGVVRSDLIGKSVMDLEYLPLSDREAYQAEDLATIASAGTVCKPMPIPFADGKLPCKFVETSVRSAEMMKYCCNNFHALKITFANETARLCEALGVDPFEVMNLVCQDTQLNISPAYLKPGFAFGGSCLPKDLRATTYLAKIHDVEIPMLAGIMQSNRNHLDLALQKLLATGKRKIGFIGLSFKTGTDDLRESPLVTLAEQLIGKGVQLAIYDPEVHLASLLGANRSFIEKHLPHIGQMMRADIEDVIAESEVLVIGLSGQAVADTLAGLVRPDQLLLDLVNLPNRDAIKAKVEGLCW